MKLSNQIAFVVLLFFLASLSCNPDLDFKGVGKVSRNIEEAKAKKVFIAEYRISNVKIYDSTIKFPFERIWLEKGWHEALDSSGHLTYKIDDSSTYMMVFSIVNGSTLNNDNYVKGKWHLKSRNQLNGSINAMICLDVDGYGRNVPDSENLQINISKTPRDYNNNLNEVATFTIRKVNEAKG
jgi:hypothetical protein